MTHADKLRLGIAKAPFDRWTMEAKRFRAMGDETKARWLEALIRELRR